MQSVDISEVERLIEILRETDRKLDREQWAKSLSDRKREEAEFHDRARGQAFKNTNEMMQQEEERGNKKFYDTARESFEYSRNWIKKNVPGRILLDYACGDGGNALFAAESDAALAIGIDISNVSIENCRRIAMEKGLNKNAYFMVGDCDSTGLPDDSVDIIVCMGCLHHLDLSYTFPELRRILKPGGRIYAHEALAYNPAIQLYRQLTPHLRTSFEKDHILSLRELKFASRFFRVENVRFFHLFSIMTTPLRKTRWFESTLKIANAIDRVVLQVPPLSYLAWQFCFELVKGDNAS